MCVVRLKISIRTKGFTMKKLLLLASAGFALLTTSASAAIDPSTIALDTTPVEVLGLTILGALAVIWVARKVVGFLGRG